MQGNFQFRFGTRAGNCQPWRRIHQALFMVTSRLIIAASSNPGMPGWAQFVPAAFNQYE
jgi:hypothetical protein